VQQQFFEYVKKINKLDNNYEQMREIITDLNQAIGIDRNLTDEMVTQIWNLDLRSAEEIRSLLKINNSKRVDAISEDTLERIAQLLCDKYNRE
jgi:DNA-directed RNA polymerase subunit F